MGRRNKMNIFKLFKRKSNLADLEKKKFHKNIDADIKRIKQINKVLDNGITLKIYHASGGHRHGH